MTSLDLKTDWLYDTEMECKMVSKQKILIVDDDNNIAELIALYLTKECFETTIVNDGESALTAVDSFAPNLILRFDAAGHRRLSGLPGSTGKIPHSHYHAFRQRGNF